jgi:mannitol-1-phosphate 5-dehydrogenase
LKKALQFGAGNIGRGFMGMLLSQSGYEVIFVDIVDKLIDQLNEQGRYSVVVVTSDGKQEMTVEGVRGINARQESEVVTAITQASLITTAVGPGALKAIAPAIARGLQQRVDLNIRMPVNIIACENLVNNSGVLQQHVLQNLPAGYADRVAEFVGFPNCVVDRRIPTFDDLKTEDPLLVVVEEYSQFVVDRGGFVGEPPSVTGMLLTDKLDGYVEQKLFTLNTGHAIAAYLGYRQGYEFVHTALGDPDIQRIVSGALQESGAMLVRRHNFDPVAQEQYAGSVLKRFQNPALPDPVVRVAREPKRKLAPSDRLIRPAELALEAGVTPAFLATGIAAALLYDYPEDEQARELSRAVKEKGIDTILRELCGLEPDGKLAQLVKAAVRQLEKPQ